ncbi:HAD family hydrolase [Corynebacterium sp. 335C]
MDAILWDMDGTLIDTEPLWGRATYALSEELGGPLTPEAREKTIGGSGPNTVRVISEHLGTTLGEDETAAAIRRLFDLFIRELRAGGAPMRPGAAELLREARAAGLPSILVTNTVRRLADEEIAIIGPELFDATLCGDEVPHGKPAPDLYLRAAEVAGAAPDACLAVEDSFTGTTAAVAAGCRVLGAPVDDHGEVADGAGRLSELTGRIDLEGFTLADLAELHGRLGAGAAAAARS